MSRINIDAYFLKMAQLASERGTCVRRKVGCIIVNKMNHVIATGYNGVGSGMPHCINNPCEGANSPSGKDLHMCKAIHAEENALIQCRDVTSIDRIYVTVSPCMSCTYKLLNTSCKEIIFKDEYPQPEAKVVWTKQNRIWRKYGRQLDCTL